jgi:hypothetical protein
MTYREIKTLKDQVKYVLQNWISSRNSDLELVERVCEIYHYNPAKKASSIERCRRYWTKIGIKTKDKLLLPTDERVLKQRRINVDEWRVAMGYPTQKTAGTLNPSWKPTSELQKKLL